MYRKNVWLEKQNSYEQIMNFAEDYKKFLNISKTEREFVTNSVVLLRRAGYLNLNEVSSIKAGDKVYLVNRDKNVIAFTIGKKPLKDGLHILGAHVDSPRLDVKQNPLYERGDFAYLDTHYYGGIKKYQWVTIPLALHGVVYLTNNTKIELIIGERDDDPILGISDLLIHLSKDQLQKNAREVIGGEDLDVTLGNIPLKGVDKEPIKNFVLRFLKEKYALEEEDFVSAELEIVPAIKARDYGLDRSMVAAYGHDDKVCAYMCLRAELETADKEYTSCLFLVDKEEIGSVGATGAHSVFFFNAIAKVAEKLGAPDPYFYAKKALENSRALSCDVSAGEDPLYPGTSDEKNGSHLGYGLTFNKYTGSGGKGGSNDANAEFVAYLRNIMNENNICYQTAELGKVDQGGGGTIAYIFANHNMEVIDSGVGVLSMHSPMEIISKADLYEGFMGYRAFLKAK